MNRGAVFLDRDGTIIRDVHYIGSPDQVVLMPGAADAIRRLNDAAWPVVVITNQSGLARGLITERDYESVHDRMEDLLAEAGAHVDATYMCPHHPDFGGGCDCRKPGTLLFRQAAADYGFDTAACWYIGDKLRDLIPARDLGGMAILVPGADTADADVAAARQEFHVASSLDEAVSRVIESARS